MFGIVRKIVSKIVSSAVRKGDCGFVVYRLPGQLSRRLGFRVWGLVFGYEWGKGLGFAFRASEAEFIRCPHINEEFHNMLEHVDEFTKDIRGLFKTSMVDAIGNELDGYQPPEDDSPIEDMGNRANFARALEIWNEAHRKAIERDFKPPWSGIDPDWKPLLLAHDSSKPIGKSGGIVCASCGGSGCGCGLDECKASGGNGDHPGLNPELGRIVEPGAANAKCEAFRGEAIVELSPVYPSLRPSILWVAMGGSVISDPIRNPSSETMRSDQDLSEECDGTSVTVKIPKMDPGRLAEYMSLRSKLKSTIQDKCRDQLIGRSVVNMRYIIEKHLPVVVSPAHDRAFDCLKAEVEGEFENIKYVTAVSAFNMSLPYNPEARKSVEFINSMIEDVFKTSALIEEIDESQRRAFANAMPPILDQYRKNPSPQLFEETG